MLLVPKCLHMQQAKVFGKSFIKVPLPSAKTTLLKLFLVQKFWISLLNMAHIYGLYYLGRIKFRFSRPFLRPVEFSISGLMKMSRCLLQKYVSLTLIKSDQTIISEEFFAQLSNSFNDENDSKYCHYDLIICFQIENSLS